MFDGVKVFAATKHQDRDRLSDVVTRWLAEKKNEIEIVDKVVRQSSDSEFHCLTIVIFFKYKRL